MRFIVASLGIQKKRFRVITISSALTAALMMTIFMAPFPSYTLAEGVVWLPDNAQLRTESDGFSGPLLTSVNSQIQSDLAILQLEDPFLQTQVEIKQAKLKELEANYRAEKFKDLVKAQIVKEQIPVAQSELARAQKKVKSMQVKSATQGQLLIPNADDLPGQFFKQGDLIGYVINSSLPIVRTLVTQDDMGKLRAHMDRVQIRLANHVEQIISAKIIRETPEATNRLPSAALSTLAGGKMILDPEKREELITLDKFFLVDVEFSPLDSNILIGTRAYVRFDHGGEPLAKQWYRSIRQLFLRQFNVW